MKFAYVALAFLFSLAICYTFLQPSPVQIAPLLVSASKAAACISLVCCAIAIHNSRLAHVLVLTSFIVYSFLFFGADMTGPPTMAEKVPKGVLEFFTGVCACLWAAAHEDKDEKATAKDVPRVR